MPTRISQDTWEKFDVLVARRGYSIKRAAAELGIGRTAASEHVKQMRLSGKDYGERRKVEAVGGEPPDPRHYDDLCENARRACDDFAFFRTFYLGRSDSPWQNIAGEEVRELLDLPTDEYCVMNEPPGVGKSTTFTHDLPAWLIVRARSQGQHIRVQVGAATSRKAKGYTMRLRRTLARPYVLEGAQGCIQADFGRFKPHDAELWRGEEFIVELLDGQTADAQEPTVLAVAQDMDFIGARADFIVWDDLVINRNSTGERLEQLQEWWTQTAETRLEPGGLLLLVGQRIGPDDLFHFALSMYAGELDPDDVEAMGEDELADLPRKYRHVVFPAHADDQCQGEHGKDAAAWPRGCMLDPRRLSWRKLSMIKTNQPDVYEISYQQKDVAPGRHLVDRLWLEGGRNVTTGELYPGCFDSDRDICEAPEGGFQTPYLSVVSVDPSPTQWWSVQWWVHESPTELRYAMDMERRKMGANDLLDQMRDGSYIGLLEDWVQRARRLGWPITHLVVERNAAQRFILQYRFFQDWLRKSGVILVPHDTSANKSDPAYGVQTIGAQYRMGRKRLPWKAGSYGRRSFQPLVDELTRWPEGATEDCVMADWFFEWNIRNLAFSQRTRKKARRPSWVRA